MTYSVDTTVKGGLPITVEYNMSGPDAEVGLFGWSVDDWSIVMVGRNKCKKHPAWLKLTQADEDKITEACGLDFDSRDHEPDYDYE